MDSLIASWRKLGWWAGPRSSSLKSSSPGFPKTSSQVKGYGGSSVAAVEDEEEVEVCDAFEDFLSSLLFLLGLFLLLLLLSLLLLLPIEAALLSLRADLPAMASMSSAFEGECAGW
jgi:hypothetical protein